MERSCLAFLCALVLACAIATPAHAGNGTVPDVVGLALDEAEGLLQQAGFTARVENVAGRPQGMVFSQSPGGFATSDTSMAVTLMVGGATPKPGMGTPPVEDAPTGPAPTEPETAPMAGPHDPQPEAVGWNGRALPEGSLPASGGPELPSVLGQTVQNARGVLRAWQVRIEQTLAVPQLAGTIVNQWPPAGDSVAAGETVTIVVAVTKRPSEEHRYVPQAEKRSLADAVSLVERAGFVAQPMSVASAASARGLVVAQSPQPGSLEIGGQEIRLYVGRGPGGYSADAPLEPTPARPEPARPTEDTPPAGSGDRPIEPGPTEPAEPTPAEPTPAAGPVLSAPSLSSPPAGESYPYKYGADFTWTTVGGAASYELELEEELPSGAWQAASSTTVTDAKYRPAKLERGRYRWRVRAVAADGAKGNWSEYRRLYMY